jgi:hypothetical protein
VGHLDGPASARLVADAILGRSPAIPTALDPARFGPVPPRRGRRAPANLMLIWRDGATALEGCLQMVPTRRNGSA